VSPAADVLDALLASIEDALLGLRCLDLHPAGLGRALLARRGRPCDGPEAASGVYALVIAEQAELERALAYAEEGASLLIAVPRGERPAFATIDRLGLRHAAHVRHAEGEWRMLVAVPAPAPAADGLPSVSLLVPTQDAFAALERLVTVVAAEDTEVAYELIVVDLGSFDETCAFARSLTGDVQLVPCRRDTSRELGLERALARARGDVALITDPHVIPTSGFIRAVAQAAAAGQPHDVWVGAVHAVGSEGPPRSGLLACLDDQWSRVAQSPEHVAPPLFAARTQPLLVAMASHHGTTMQVPRAIGQLLASGGTLVPVAGLEGRSVPSRRARGAA
jgi:hypothetical protein